MRILSHRRLRDVSSEAIGDEAQVTFVLGRFGGFVAQSVGLSPGIR
jgi:hypothetical protein